MIRKHQSYIKLERFRDDGIKCSDKNLEQKHRDCSNVVYSNLYGVNVFFY
jgi:hypothetical protein